MSARRKSCPVRQPKYFAPVLKASTRPDIALDCHAGLASRKAWTLGGARRQFGRRRLQIGHGIDPGKVSMAIGECEISTTNPAFRTETAALLRDRTNPGGRAFRLT
jgi:hypothetical protein